MSAELPRRVGVERPHVQAVSHRPGKNFPSNRAIPCLHADPCIGDLAPGEARTVQGEPLLTRASLELIVSEVAAKQSAGRSAVASSGLASQYPGDDGIERDPRVLFSESFETGTLADIAKRWSETSNKDGKVMNLVADAPSGSAAKRSLQVTATLGENTGGHLYKRLRRGVEKLHARFYVKFAEDAGSTHHFVSLGGYTRRRTGPGPARANVRAAATASTLASSRTATTCTRRRISTSWRTKACASRNRTRRRQSARPRARAHGQTSRAAAHLHLSRRLAQ